MYKIAVIGDYDSIYGFATLGLSICPVKTREDARKKLKQLADGQYGIIYITEAVAAQIEEEKKDQKNTALDGTESTLTAYVDGSFDPSIGKYAFGCILLTPEGETIRESGNGQDPESLAIRNVAGEMLGAMYAVQWAINHGYPSLTIYYDYEGIAKWAQGDWKAKNKRTQQYAEFMNGKRSYIQLSFQKVKAHSGDHYNEEVDKLAKSALVNGNGIPRISRT